jgi:chromate reductase, NAD(P)H dehydrogenase (quinone)
MSRHKIAILVGSLRKNSINRRIATSICSLATDVLDCGIVEIRDLPHYNADDEANVVDAVSSFRQQISQADGILFCTPEYNRGVPGVLKNAIDVGSRPYGKSVWDKKPGAIVSASPGGIGGFGANHQLRQACVFLNMPIMQQPEAYLGHVTEESFNQNGKLIEGPLRDLVTQLAMAFADWVDVMVRSRKLLAEDAAHKQAAGNR